MTESVAAFKFIVSERKKFSGKRFNMENNVKIVLIFLRIPGSRLHFLRCPVSLMPDPRRVRRCWQGDQEGAEPYQLQKAVCPVVLVPSSGS